MGKRASRVEKMQLLPQFSADQFAQKMIGTEQQRQEAITEATDSLALLLDSNFDLVQSKWQALAAATIAQRKRLGYGPTPILIRRTGSEALRARATKEREAQVQGLIATGSVHSDDEIAV